ncbi:MAG: hypothetical protein ISQ10_01415 [Planctomycetes bacterium]|nr:hypothetical protein [Planctomycetota bacterium]MBL6909105.1 hypothetical protein [Pirellulales bacterium]MBL7182716.1 hypothetical protein [Pirellulales bacterium]RZO65773.1 MAG: hypothetical protein EVA78_01930 [Phycisphaeraceae bacterium]
MFRSTPGSMLVIGLLALGLLAAGIGVWFQWQQTRRCLAFYGTRATEQISKSPFVELWQLKPLSGGRHTGRLEAVLVEDITEAKGLVHLRRGLVEDANFQWVEGNTERAPLADAAWDLALVFFDSKQRNESERTVVVIDFGENSQKANLTVVGRPGRVALGKMGKGLKTWVESTANGSVRTDF